MFQVSELSTTFVLQGTICSGKELSHTWSIAVAACLLALAWREFDIAGQEDHAAILCNSIRSSGALELIGYFDQHIHETASYTYAELRDPRTREYLCRDTANRYMRTTTDDANIRWLLENACENLQLAGDPARGQMLVHVGSMISEGLCGRCDLVPFNTRYQQHTDSSIWWEAIVAIMTVQCMLEARGNRGNIELLEEYLLMDIPYVDLSVLRDQVRELHPIFWMIGVHAQLPDLDDRRFTS